MKHPMLKDNDKFKARFTLYERIVIAILIIAAGFAVSGLWVAVHFITKFW